jgi:hypothetical protein
LGRGLPEDNEAGQALAVVILLVAVLIVAASVGVIAVTRSGATSRLASDRQVAQGAAQSGAELFFVSLNNGGAFPPAGTAQSARNVYPVGLAGNITSTAWYQLTGTGLAACPATLTATCIQITDALQQITNSATSSPPYLINVQVDARTNCRSGTVAAPTGCALARLEQRISPRQFTNYMEFDNSEFLDPQLYGQQGGTYQSWYTSCTSGGTAIGDVTAANNSLVSSICQVPAYLGPSAYYNTAGTSSGDVLGPIATNDQAVYICGTGPTQAGQPLFNATPQATGSNSTLPQVVQEYPVPLTSTNAQACTGAPVNPGQAVAASGLPLSTSPLAQIASSQDTFSSATNIVLSGSTTPSASTYSSNPQNGTPVTASKWPATGVIYVNGNAYVSGAACQGVTVAASGNIYIVNNIINQRLHATGTGCAGSIGLVAGGSVVVQPAFVGQVCTTTGPCTGTATSTQIQCWTDSYAECQVVDAAVMALGYAGGTSLPAPTSAPGGGSFYLQGWNTDIPPQGALPTGGGQPTCGTSGEDCALVFTGSITEAFRGAFGVYATSTGTAIVGTGINKQFSFDTSLVSSQPPYFLTPVSGIWQRTGTTYSGGLQQ